MTCSAFVRVASIKVTYGMMTLCRLNRSCPSMPACCRVSLWLECCLLAAAFRYLTNQGISRNLHCLQIASARSH